MELCSLGAHLLLSPAGGALIPDFSDLQFAFTSYQGHWGLLDLTHSLFRPKNKILIHVRLINLSIIKAREVPLGRGLK